MSPALDRVLKRLARPTRWPSPIHAKRGLGRHNAIPELHGDGSDIVTRDQSGDPMHSFNALVYSENEGVVYPFNRHWYVIEATGFGKLRKDLHPW